MNEYSLAKLQLVIILHYFLQGYHHEVALSHQGMRYSESGFIDLQVIVEQDVDVDRTIFVGLRIGALRGVLAGFAQFTLNLLGGIQDAAGGEGRLTKDDAIQELMHRLEAPGCCLNEGGLACHRPYPFADQPYCRGYACLTVAEITSQPQIHLMQRSAHPSLNLLIIQNQHRIAEAAELIAILHGFLVSLVNEIVATE